MVNTYLKTVQENDEKRLQHANVNKLDKALDIIASYLTSEGIHFTVDTNGSLYTPQLEVDGECVAITVRSDSNSGAVIFTADAGIKIESQNVNEVIKFLNMINAGNIGGSFYLCPESSIVRYRTTLHSCCKALTNSDVEQILEDIYSCLLAFAKPARLICPNETSAEEMIAKLLTVASIN